MSALKTIMSSTQSAEGLVWLITGTSYAPSLPPYLQDESLIISLVSHIYNDHAFTEQVLAASSLYALLEGAIRSSRLRVRGPSPSFTI